jgi:GNAT superfamily N-acetyltransferase
MIEIVDYRNEHAADFRKINLEWLDLHGLTEPADLEVLDQPSLIFDHGGHIFIALERGHVIGTSALMRHGESEFELAKMSVAPELRGKGISKLLMDACLAKARSYGATKVILFSSTKLTAALKLYERYGFRHVPLEDSPFLTADVKMELML